MLYDTSPYILWKLCFMTSLLSIHISLSNLHLWHSSVAVLRVCVLVYSIHILYVSVCVCVRVSVSICYICSSECGGCMSASTCACSLSVWCMRVCGRKEMQQGFGTHTRSCCSSGLPFLLSVGMYSLRRRAWLEHSPTVQWHLFFSLAFRQTDRAMGDSVT